jgi:hypothetical protein
LRTNVILPDLNAIWYLGVPNNESTNVNFTIHAILPTNGMLISGQPIRVVISPPSATSGPPLRWNSVDGERYQIQVSSNLFVWSVFTTITASGKSQIFVDPNPVIGVPARFYRVIQVP